MSANPQLSQVSGQGLFPLPFDTERLLLSREIEFSVDGVQTQGGSWSGRGRLFLSNLRIVLVADKEDSSGKHRIITVYWEAQTAPIVTTGGSGLKRMQSRPKAYPMNGE